MSKYFAINSENQAKALNWIGFKYMKFTDKEYGTIYSFENTKEFQQALKDIRNLKIKYRH